MYRSGDARFCCETDWADTLWTVLLKWIKPKSDPQAVSQTGQESKTKDIADDELPTITGLDVTLGLRRVLGKKRCMCPC